MPPSLTIFRTHMVEGINFQKLSSLLYTIVLVHTKYKIKAKKMFKQDSEET